MLTINTEALRDALRVTVIDTRCAQVIYSHALFVLIGEKKDEQQIAITTTNEGQTLTRFLPATFSGIKNFTADVLQLSAALYGIDDETVTLEAATATQLVLRVGRRHYNINSLPAAQFPIAPDFDEQRLDVDTATLLEGLRTVQYCRHKKRTEEPISGVCIGNGHVVATDGVRCAVMPCEVGGLDVSIVLPHQAVPIILNIIRDSATVFLSITTLGAPVALRFSDSDILLSVQLLNGKYPNWRPLVLNNPGSAKTTSTFRTHDMANALKRLAPFAMHEIDGATSHRLRIEANSIQGALTLTTQHKQSEDYIDAEVPNNFYVELNGLYISEMLKNCKADKINWHYNDANAPQVFTADDHPATHYIAVMRGAAPPDESAA